MSRPPEHPPGWKNRQDSKTYRCRAVCDNCNDEQSFDVPKGVLAVKYLNDKKCENCGCWETLRPALFQ